MAKEIVPAGNRTCSWRIPSGIGEGNSGTWMHLGLEKCRSIRPLGPPSLERKKSSRTSLSQNFGVHGVHPDFRIFRPTYGKHQVSMLCVRSVRFNREWSTPGGQVAAAKHGFVKRLHRLARLWPSARVSRLPRLELEGQALSFLERFSAWKRSFFLPPRSINVIFGLFVFPRTLQ